MGVDISVVLSVHHLPPNVTLADYVNTEILHQRFSINNYNLIQSSSINIDGNPGHKVIYSISNDGKTYYIMEVFVLKNNILYVVDYMASESNFYNYLTHMENIVKSLKTGQIPDCKKVEEGLFNANCVTLR